MEKKHEGEGIFKARMCFRWTMPRNPVHHLCNCFIISTSKCVKKLAKIQLQTHEFKTIFPEFSLRLGGFVIPIEVIVAMSLRHEVQSIVVLGAATSFGFPVASFSANSTA